MVSAIQRMLLRDLWHLRGQVIAAMLVVACGISVFVATRSTYESLLQAQAQYYEHYRFAQLFAHLKRAPDSLLAEISRLPGVGQVDRRVVMDVTLNIPGLTEPATGRLVSLDSGSTRRLNDLHLQQGRLPQPGQPDEVLLSATFAAANHLRPGDHLSAILNGRWQQLTVVGTALSPEYIYEVGNGMLFPDNRRFGVMWMDYDVMAPAFGMQGAFNDLALSLAPGAQAKAVIARLDPLLAPYGGLGAYARDEQQSNRFLTDELGEIRVTTTLVPTLFLAVAAFLLYIVLTRLVAMQRAEIAQLKAFGYSNLTVGLHYLKFALATVALGLALGIPGGLYLGSLYVDLYREYFHFPRLELLISPQLLQITLLISLLAASTGAISAVWRASRLPPAEAMRPEAPPLFRPGWVERSGMLRQWTPAWRMIFRNLMRRRWKAVLSITGISLAIGLMVVGRFMLDSATYMLDQQFNRVQRDDVTLALTEARPMSALDEIMHLPGVLQAEAFRAVPVRLRYQHRSKQVQLTGLPAASPLRQIVDLQGRSIKLPAEGLVLTTKLAEILGVVPGDTLSVELLEGRRGHYQVRVAGVANEMLGLNAYMERHALSRLLNEEPLMSGAFLRIDSRHADQLYQALKTLPSISATIIRGALIDSIQDSLDRSFNFFSAFMVTLASVIVGGMVYNSVRIALSERGNELASLRVLGFTQREVGFILLGEQVLLLVAAIPFGLLLGYGLCMLLVPAFDREMFRLPLVLEPRSFVYPVLTTLAAALLSGLLVARRLKTLDLIAVLKTRE